MLIPAPLICKSDSFLLFASLVPELTVRRWTASTLMPADQQSTITNGSPYNPDQSSNYQEMDGSTYGLFYADGSGSTGPAGTDTVTVGGATVPNMPFGLCSNLTYGSGETSRDTEGPLGLGFGSENSIRPNPQCTFMECLEPYVPEPVFSTHFKTDDTSTIDFGWVDTSKYTGDFIEAPIANTSQGNEGQWVIQGISFGSGGNSFNVNALDMDFDTGTASLSVSSDIANAYWGLVPGSDAQNCQYPCGTDLPGLDFTFTDVNGASQTFTVPGDNIKNGDGNSGDTCGSWMNVVDGRGNGGTPVYITKYMVWNQQKPSLSFADQA